MTYRLFVLGLLLLVMGCADSEPSDRLHISTGVYRGKIDIGRERPILVSLYVRENSTKVVGGSLVHRAVHVLYFSKPWSCRTGLLKQDHYNNELLLLTTTEYDKKSLTDYWTPELAPICDAIPMSQQVRLSQIDKDIYQLVIQFNNAKYTIPLRQDWKTEALFKKNGDLVWPRYNDFKDLLLDPGVDPR